MCSSRTNSVPPLTHDEILHCYTNPRHSGSYGGPDRLSKSLKISKKICKDALESLDAYSKIKRVAHKFVRRKISAVEIDYLWQIDLVAVSNYARFNKGFHYLLTCIDVCSRFAFVIPVKRKNAEDVTNAFSELLTRCKRKPKFIQSDQGLEFFNSKFKSLLKTLGVKLYHNHSPLKAAMIERFNRTLMTRLQKVFTHRGKNVYHDVLDDELFSYNSNVHSSTKFDPASVTKYNQMDVWFNSNADLLTRVRHVATLKVNDFVRIKINKKIFTKGYASTYSNEVYKVTEVINSNPITYKISDNTKTTVLGIFYDSELSRVKL